MRMIAPLFLSMTSDETPENNAPQSPDEEGQPNPDTLDELDHLTASVRRVSHERKKRRLKSPRDLFAGADEPDEHVENLPPPVDPEPETQDPTGLTEKHRNIRDSLPSEIFDDEAVDRALDALDSFGRPIEPVKDRYPPVDPAREMANDQNPTVKAAPDGIRPRRNRTGLYNAIAIFFAFATIAVFAYYSILWNNPWSPLNPLPPATPFVQITATPDPIGGFAAVPTQAAPATAPAFAVTPTLPVDLTAQVAPAESDGFPFRLAADEILYTPNANGRECNWSSIAGTVTALDGSPINNYGVQIINVENPDALDRRVFSGSAVTIGPGGFELSLGGVPLQGRYSVQLFSPAGVAISDIYDVFTSDQCDQNVVVIQFRQVGPL